MCHQHSKLFVVNFEHNFDFGAPGEYFCRFLAAKLSTVKHQIGDVLDVSISQSSNFKRGISTQINVALYHYHSLDLQDLEYRRSFGIILSKQLTRNFSEWFIFFDLGMQTVECLFLMIFYVLYFVVILYKCIKMR